MNPENTLFGHRKSLFNQIFFIKNVIVKFIVSISAAEELETCPIDI